MYLGGLDSLVKGHIGKNGWQALGEHRLARAGRADHQDVVTSCGGDLKSALCLQLTAHVGEIKLRRSCREVESAALVCHRCDLLCAAQVIHKLTERPHRIDRDAVNDCGLACVLLGDEKLASAEVARGYRH